MKTFFTLAIVIICYTNVLFAQSVGINSDGSAPNGSAMLDVRAANKGLLIPNVALTGTTDATTITTPAVSLLVYNSATVSNVTPGYYYYNGTSWVRLMTGILSDRVAVFLETPTSANFAAAITNETGTGAVVLSIHPTLVAPILGIASANSMVIGAPSANASAALDVTSTTQGFLPPRLTYLEKKAIPNPAAGLIIWCSDCASLIGELQVYNGNTWTNMVGGLASTPFVLGQSYGGGKIFYIDESGYHGLITAPYDQSLGAAWGCAGTSIPGTSLSFGTGQANTTLIINGCSTAGIASGICNNLVLNGYSDWYLPSLNEFVVLDASRYSISGLGLTGDYYWTSSAIDSENAYIFSVGIYTNSEYYSWTKGSLWRVRAIRSF